jgi:hypothetical protein
MNLVKYCDYVIILNLEQFLTDTSVVSGIKETVLLKGTLFLCYNIT